MKTRCSVKITNNLTEVQQLLNSICFANEARIVCSHDELKSIKNILDQTETWTQWKGSLDLSSLISSDLFDTFILSKRFICLSDGLLDRDDVFAILDGVLFLSLTTDSYYSAGLLGTKSQSNPGKHNIIIDLNSSEYSKGSKSFERLQWVASNTLNRSWNGIVAAAGGHDSLRSMFGLDAVKPIWIESRIFSAITPVFELNADDTNGMSKESRERYSAEARQEFASNIYEWIGMIILQSPLINFGNEIDPYLSQYEVFDAQHNPKDLCILHFNGLMASSTLSRVFASLANIPSNPLILHISGPRNSPAGWNYKEHRYGNNGEMSCTVVRLLPDQYMTFKLSNH